MVSTRQNKQFRHTHCSELPAHGSRSGEPEMCPAPVRGKAPVCKPKSTLKAKDVDDTGNTPDAVSPRGRPEKNRPCKTSGDVFYFNL